MKRIGFLFLSAILLHPWTMAGQAPDSAGDLFPSGQPLDRTRLIEAVLSRNPSVEAARQAVQAALARYPQVTSLEDPMLSISTAPLSIGASERFGAGASISQRLPWPGKLALRGAVVRAEAEAESSDLEAVKLQIAVMASTLYDEYYATGRSLDINAAHISLLGDLKSSAEAQYVVGNAAQQDPLQAEVELANLFRQQVALESRFDVVRAQLNELLHRSPAATLPPPPASLPIPALPAGTSGSMQEVALQNRPALTAAAARIRAARAAVDLSELAFRPDFEVMGSYSSMWMSTAHQYMVGVGINLPLQKEKRRAAVTEASAKLAQAESERDTIEDRVRSEVDIAYRKAIESERVLRIYSDRLLPAARDQIASAKAGFVTSRNDFRAVMTAENNLRTVELDYELALADLYRSLADLDRAAGRVPYFSPQPAPARLAAGE